MDDISDYIKSGDGSTITYWVIALALVIGIGSVSYVAFSGPQDTTTTSTNDGTVTTSGNVAREGQGAFFSTITHPKVLGLTVILLIAMFSVYHLAGSVPTK